MENGEQDSRGRDRSFWILFSAGWAVYAGLMTVTAAVEGHPVLPHLASALPPAAFATAIAARRKLFLKPDWSLWKTVAVHLGIGILYALASGLGAVSLLVVTGGFDPIFPGEDPSVAFVVFSFYYLLLYAVLAGFMMWAESLYRVEESRALAAREAVLRAEAEAKAVRAQFNPHFVFNTLHSLMLLVRADPMAAERAIEDVAALIRYASILDREDQDTVPLGQEVEVAKRYLGLEALRLSDRLQVRWEIDSGLERVAVPPFSLQTLLDNAIKHGLSPKPEGGSITIRIRRDSGSLTVSVEDDGLGADPKEVQRAEGKGLHLLQRRVSTLFGDTASLTWTTSPGEGFSVHLQVPVSEARRSVQLPVSGDPKGHLP